MPLVRVRALVVTVAITSALTVGVAVAPASAAPASVTSVVAAVHAKKKHVKVPKLVGLDGKSATKKLHAHHLKFKFDQDVWVQSNWTVDKSVPKAGKTVKPGKTITLIVSKHKVATTPAPSAPAPPPALAVPAPAPCW